MKMTRTSTYAALLAMSLMPIMNAAQTGTKKTPFGKMPDGQAIDLYTMTNHHGMEVAIMNYGGIIVSVKVPDSAGHFDDVVLGFDNLAGYLQPEPYFGALIGRYANRIGHAQFTLDGKTYHLAKNDGDNTLHGGLKGFDKRVWTAHQTGPLSLQLTYLSKDGEENFPGNLTAVVTYTLTDDNEIKIDYSATTDKDTVLNLTNHSYWNLAGQGNGDILGDQIMINADRFTPVDSGLIPTGELKSVAGTPLDLRKLTVVGAHIDDNNEQMKLGKGYDHNFVLNRHGAGLSLAARVVEPKSGRSLEVSTTQPGIQFYTGNFLDGTIHGKGGKVYGHRSALCLETQHFPDTPNRPSFPTAELKPGQTYHETTVYRFSITK